LSSIYFLIDICFYYLPIELLTATLSINWKYLSD